MSMFKKTKLAKEGFTLIELLVVIAIIGILASVVLASLNSARLKSRDARRIADIKQIQLALELSFDANIGTGQGYPALLSSLSTDGYIASVPNDPLSAPYTYERCNATMYHVGAALEDPANPALSSDFDAMPAGCSGNWGPDGSAGSPAVCSGFPGVDQGSHCYDLRP
ncbi:MAG: prepilin-type N-terminal cleavage/methylation domain-containing protein [bacterium]|nr:prepilin-type N-terminal cleavage/methylation domain-containing protein [bacterium]